MLADDVVRAAPRESRVVICRAFVTVFEYILIRTRFRQKNFTSQLDEGMSETYRCFFQQRTKSTRVPASLTEP
jgi:hypothetical protein